jgi:hypothetical protein
MGAYDGLLKDRLRELCLERGLIVSGTVAELVARLEGADAAQADTEQEPDLLVEAGIGQDELEPVDEAPVQQPPAAREPEQEPGLIHDSGDPMAANRTVHRVRFECGNPGVLQEYHEAWLRATENAALGAGHTIRGSARRVSFEDDGGKHYAIYEVSLGRRRHQVG